MAIVKAKRVEIIEALLQLVVQAGKAINWVSRQRDPIEFPIPDDIPFPVRGPLCAGSCGVEPVKAPETCPHLVFDGILKVMKTGHPPHRKAKARTR